MTSLFFITGHFTEGYSPNLNRCSLERNRSVFFETVNVLSFFLLETGHHVIIVFCPPCSVS